MTLLGGREEIFKITRVVAYVNPCVCTLALTLMAIVHFYAQEHDMHHNASCAEDTELYGHVSCESNQTGLPKHHDTGSTYTNQP